MVKIVVGLQYGDEGKGKITDIMAQDASHIVRFNGGNNAGHTLVVAGQKTVLHLLPSAVLHRNKVICIAAGVVIDPEVLLRELPLAEINDARVVIDRQAHIILPQAKQIEARREARHKIGTTGRGIGPTYEAKMARTGIRVEDLLDRDTLSNKLNLYCQLWDVAYSHEELVQYCLDFGDKIKRYVGVVSSELELAADDILMEGAQGTFLDIDHGTYPYVTSSNTLASHACTSAGIGPTRVSEVMGVMKAYATRVGEGPFPSEGSEAESHKLRLAGNEFGATTGRPRRCGWLNIAEIKKANRLNGVTKLALTKLDVLTGFPYVKVWRGDKYLNYPGWDQSLRGISQRKDLPENAQRFLTSIEQELGYPFHIISVGPGREETIFR